MTLNEFRQHPQYKNRLIGDTMYKRVLDGKYRDYVWEHDIWVAENNGDLDEYSDWLACEVEDIYIDNAEVVQVNLAEAA